ncbi:MAG: PAS domain-containing protein, partial [Halobacteriales archaeon]|nr:PAS domain-containing protein [Halobacteriales archaeon]
MTEFEGSSDDDGSRARFQSLFERANDAIALVKFRAGTPIIEEANQTFQATFVNGDESVIGRDLDEIVALGNRKRAADDLSQRVQRGEVNRRTITRDTVDGVRHIDRQGLTAEDGTVETPNPVVANNTHLSHPIERT